MRAYSLEKRREVYDAAVKRGDLTIEEVADKFNVGPTFIKKLLRQQRESGDLNPKPHGGGHPRRLSAKHLDALREEATRSPGATIKALRAGLIMRFNLKVSVSTVSRALDQLDIPRKKRYFRPRNEQA